jgi:hypothetical protein
VFNPLYVPTSADEKALFAKQQKYGYQVLEQAIQSSEGMVIVWEHSQTKNAQALYAKLQSRYAHSQAATLAQDALEQELSDLHLDTTWKRGCVPFLVAWKNGVMDLENLQRNWLSQSLYLHTEIRQALGVFESMNSS